MANESQEIQSPKKLSRRDFLKLGGATLGVGIAAALGIKLAEKPKETQLPETQKEPELKRGLISVKELLGENYKMTPLKIGEPDSNNAYLILSENLRGDNLQSSHFYLAGKRKEDFFGGDNVSVSVFLLESQKEKGTDKYIAVFIDNATGPSENHKIKPDRVSLEFKEKPPREKRSYLIEGYGRLTGVDRIQEWEQKDAVLLIPIEVTDRRPIIENENVFGKGPTGGIIPDVIVINFSEGKSIPDKHVVFWIATPKYWRERFEKVYREKEKRLEKSGTNQESIDFINGQYAFVDVYRRVLIDQYGQAIANNIFSSLDKG